ncbi:hypothetical protein BpHYR1_010572 [Brachionus plicatilis]|uniref:Uncharacterized protein n=1 Tax=Brachionus plicatilis TaxID=10195 RepID=A0A3M7Q827_BRAPC|nr:hypothetical protein BpHYR1_010572 [Brachionus plicatilis]
MIYSLYHRWDPTVSLLRKRLIPSLYNLWVASNTIKILKSSSSSPLLFKKDLFLVVKEKNIYLCLSYIVFSTYPPVLGLTFLHRPYIMIFRQFELIK